MEALTFCNARDIAVLTDIIRFMDWPPRFAVDRVQVIASGAWRAIGGQDLVEQLKTLGVTTFR